MEKKNTITLPYILRFTWYKESQLNCNMGRYWYHLGWHWVSIDKDDFWQFSVFKSEKNVRNMTKEQSMREQWESLVPQSAVQLAVAK